MAKKLLRTILCAILLALLCLSAAQLPPVDAEPGAVPPLTWTYQPNDDEEIEEFSTAFESVIPSAYLVNQTVPLRLLLPRVRTGKIPAVVILHYWGATDLRLERTVAGDLTRKGIAALIVTLPYHLSRTPAGTRSGQMAVRPDPEALKQNMVQSVSDVRRAVSALLARPDVDEQNVAITGTSLGCIVSTLVYGLDERIKSAGFMLGGVDLAHILWNSSKVVAERDTMRSRGFTEAKLRQELQGIEPLRFFRRSSYRALVIGAKFDTVIPPEDTRKLAEAMPGTKPVWIDTGHYGGVFVQRRIVRLVTEFLVSELKGGDFVAPKGMYAPTVRIGAGLSYGRGLEIGVGLDLFASKDRKFFSTFYATPKGPQLFVGGRLDDHFAIGAFGSLKKIAPGVLWSVIL